MWEKFSNNFFVGFGKNKEKEEKMYAIVYLSSFIR